jgi:Glu-tRNA(Gln) amidotransferase subunit E-like FAD-binding protein
MSLEQALQENTNAILKLAGLIAASQANISIVQTPAVTAAVEVAHIETTTTTDVEKHLNATEEVETEQAGDGLQDASVTVITRDDVKNALLSVAKKSRADLQEILGNFGAANISALKESDFAEVIRLADQVLETADA